MVPEALAKTSVGCDEWSCINFVPFHNPEGGQSMGIPKSSSLSSTGGKVLEFSDGMCGTRHGGGGEIADC